MTRATSRWTATGGRYIPRSVTRSSERVTPGEFAVFMLPEGASQAAKETQNGVRDRQVSLACADEQSCQVATPQTIQGPAQFADRQGEFRDAATARLPEACQSNDISGTSSGAWVRQKKGYTQIAADRATLNQLGKKQSLHRDRRAAPAIASSGVFVAEEGSNSDMGSEGLTLASRS